MDLRVTDDRCRHARILASGHRHCLEQICHL